MPRNTAILSACGNNGFIASFGVALLGACVLIGIVKLVTGRGNGALRS